jgi:hypothetical protein
MLSSYVVAVTFISPENDVRLTGIYAVAYTLVGHITTKAWGLEPNWKELFMDPSHTKKLPLGIPTFRAQSITLQWHLPVRDRWMCCTVRHSWLNITNIRLSIGKFQVHNWLEASSLGNYRPALSLPYSVPQPTKWGAMCRRTGDSSPVVAGIFHFQIGPAVTL